MKTTTYRWIMLKYMNIWLAWCILSLYNSFTKWSEGMNLYIKSAKFIPTYNKQKYIDKLIWNAWKHEINWIISAILVFCKWSNVLQWNEAPNYHLCGLGNLLFIIPNKFYRFMHFIFHHCQLFLQTFLLLESYF